MDMTIVRSGRPIGASVSGVSLNALPEDAFETIRGLVHECGVIAIKDQDLSEPDQIGFARRFGDLQKIFIKEALSTDYPELFFVSNIIEDGKPKGSTDAGRFWHTDGAYLSKPHSVSMLYAIEIPYKDGIALGDTDFAGMGAAFDALPEEMKQRIDGLRAIHDVNYRYGRTQNAENMLKRTVEFPPVSHPLVIRHPATGRKCLYLSEGYTSAIEGLPEAESAALLKQLCEHAQRPEFQYRHSWSPGDLLIWDNRSTLHHANFDYALPQRRLMRRATVAGESLG
jgi:taurine dioxygenase